MKTEKRQTVKKNLEKGPENRKISVIRHNGAIPSIRQRYDWIALE